MIGSSTGAVILYDPAKIILPTNRIYCYCERAPINKHPHHFFFLTAAKEVSDHAKLVKVAIWEVVIYLLSMI